MENVKQNAIEQVKQGIETLERRLSKRENPEWSERLEQYKTGLVWLEANDSEDFWKEMRGQDFQAMAILVATKDFANSGLPVGAVNRLFGGLI